jgi:hypothetical protein
MCRFVLLVEDHCKGDAAALLRKNNMTTPFFMQQQGLEPRPNSNLLVWTIPPHLLLPLYSL